MTDTTTDYKVADISLADFGRKEIRLAEEEMPGLMSNREIAEDLYISENTVKNHVRNILEKLHLHSRMEAVVYAVREKLLDIT